MGPVEHQIAEAGLLTSGLWFWCLVLGIGLGNFFFRSVFIFAMDAIRMPPLVSRMLRFIPASVLAAVIGPMLFLHQGTVAALGGKERLCAGLIAIVVAYSKGSMLLTIVAGMGSLFALQHLLG